MLYVVFISKPRFLQQPSLLLLLSWVNLEIVLQIQSRATLAANKSLIHDLKCIVLAGIIS